MGAGGLTAGGQLHSLISAAEGYGWGYDLNKIFRIAGDINGGYSLLSGGGLLLMQSFPN